MSAPSRPDWATIPNLVTLARFALLVPICVMLLDGPDALTVVLLLVWACTDWVDGLLARALDQVSRTGEIIDPIADRLGLAAIVLALAMTDLLPWATLVIILVADVTMVALATGAALGGRLGVTTLGKIRTFLLMSAVFLLVAAGAWAPQMVPAVQVLLWIGVVLHVVCAVDYIVRARRAGRREPVAEGPPSPR